MSYVLLIIYVIFSVGGATLVKYASVAKDAATLFTIPLANMAVNWMTLVGILGYGVSFCLYIVLLNRLDISFLTPVTTAVVYTLLMLVSFLVFQESFTLWKVIGCILILVGVVLVVMNK